jgi:hypothetical protein
MTFTGCIRQNKCMLRWALWVAMVGGTGIAAFPQTPAPGVVHASVAVTADPINSYSLYLPSAYSPARRWPLLLAFDAFARGETSVNLFHDRKKTRIYRRIYADERGSGCTRNND